MMSSPSMYMNMLVIGNWSSSFTYTTYHSCTFEGSIWGGLFKTLRVKKLWVYAHLGFVLVLLVLNYFVQLMEHFGLLRVYLSYASQFGIKGGLDNWTLKLSKSSSLSLNTLWKSRWYSNYCFHILKYLEFFSPSLNVHTQLQT